MPPPRDLDEPATALPCSGEEHPLAKRLLQAWPGWAVGTGLATSRDTSPTALPSEGWGGLPEWTQGDEITTHPSVGMWVVGAQALCRAVGGFWLPAQPQAQRASLAAVLSTAWPVDPGEQRRLNFEPAGRPKGAGVWSLGFCPTPSGRLTSCG